MNNNVYQKLVKVLDTLPNGFPATEDGTEIKILKKIFTPEEADLFCDLRLSPETAAQIAERTGRPLAGLDELLTAMWRRGELKGAELSGTMFYMMIPWVVGIYEFQVERMDKELAALCEEYMLHFGPPFIQVKPEIMQVIPIESEIPVEQEALPYKKITEILNKSQSFAVNECICNKEKRLLGKGCDKPKEICMGLSVIPGVFDNHPWGRKITREEAFAIMKKAEDFGLVHLATNVKNGQWWICNCCECCCPVLGGLKHFGTGEHVNASYYAAIDPGECTSCGVCAEERCQVAAIDEEADMYMVNQKKCIGCGLCVTTCPTDAITLVPRPTDEITPTPETEEEWFDKRSEVRGIDYSKYK